MKQKHRHTWIPIEREHEIKCNLVPCAGGMGLAGNGQCFLGGNPYIEKCPNFISYEDFEKEGCKKDKIMTAITRMLDNPKENGVYKDYECLEEIWEIVEGEQNG